MKKGIATVIAELLLILLGIFIIFTLSTDFKYRLFPLFKKINKDYDRMETMSFSSVDASLINDSVLIENTGYTNLTNITIVADYKIIGVIPGPLQPGNATIFKINETDVNRIYIFTLQGAKTEINANRST